MSITGRPNSTHTTKGHATHFFFLAQPRLNSVHVTTADENGKNRPHKQSDRLTIRLRVFKIGRVARYEHKNIHTHLMALFDGVKKEDEAIEVAFMIFHSGTEAGFPGRFSWRTPADPNRPNSHQHVAGAPSSNSTESLNGKSKERINENKTLPAKSTTTTTMGYDCIIQFSFAIERNSPPSILRYRIWRVTAPASAMGGWQSFNS